MTGLRATDFAAQCLESFQLGYGLFRQVALVCPVFSGQGIEQKPCQCLRFIYQSFEGFFACLAHHRVGIFPLGQKHKAHCIAGLQQWQGGFQCAPGGFFTGVIAS